MRETFTAEGTTWRRRLLVGLATAACMVPAGLTAAAAPAAAATPVLVEVRAAQHPGYDRVVFEFTGRGPSSYSVGYVTTLVADASGKTVTQVREGVVQAGQYVVADFTKPQPEVTPTSASTPPPAPAPAKP